MLDIARKRRAFLERLAATPAWKRDLIDDLGRSRSTVDRAVASLVDAGLVERTDAGFVTTYSGRLMLDQVREAAAVVDTVADAAGTLNHLPTDIPREGRFFDGATIVSMEERSPAAVLRGITEVASEADRFRGAAFVANDERFIDTLFGRSVEAGPLEVEFLVTEPLAAWMSDAYADRVRAIVGSDHADVHVVESLPHAFYLAERDSGTTAYLGVHGDHDNFVGYVENDSRAAVEWVAARWAAHRGAATPFERHLREAGRWSGD
jgi:predicted transcriptional regulator